MAHQIQYRIIIVRTQFDKRSHQLDSIARTQPSNRSAATAAAAAKKLNN